MSHSENISDLASALSKAQGEMQAAIKDSVNPFYKSKYADLGSVWDACRPVLSKHGLCVLQSTEIVGDKIVMVTTLAHSSGQWMKSHLPLNPAKNDSQGVGAAITYLRRYSLSALVGVVCDDDDDGETASGRGRVKDLLIKHEQKKPEQTKVTPILEETKISTVQSLHLQQEFLKIDSECRKNMWLYLRDKGVDEGKFDLIPESQYMILINGINRNLEKNKAAAVK